MANVKSSDGTEVGTMMVKDVDPGSDGSDYLDWLTDLRGTLFFQRGRLGPWIRALEERWDQGRDRAREGHRPGPDGSNPAALTDVGGTLMFFAYDSAGGAGLWKSDGTEAGTVLLKSIDPSRNPPVLTDARGTLFFHADDGVHGPKLWKSNGTRAGTVLVKDINPGSGASSVSPGQTLFLVPVRGVLFIAAKDGVHGNELWKGDGNRARTVLVKDIRPGPKGSVPQYLTAVGGTLFCPLFKGDDLWKSNGTKAGTVLVKRLP